MKYRERKLFKNTILTNSIKFFSWLFFFFLVLFRRWKIFNYEAWKILLLILANKMFYKFFAVFGDAVHESYKIARRSIYDIFNSYFLHYQAKFRSLKITLLHWLKIESSFQYLSFNTYLTQILFSPYFPYISNANVVVHKVSALVIYMGNVFLSARKKLLSQNTELNNLGKYI